MCGRGSDLVADEVGDVDARAHPGVDLIPGRKRSGPQKLGLLPASVEGHRFGRGEGQARDVIHGNHVRVAGLARGDACFSDELPRARPVDHLHTTVLALSPDLHVTGQEEVHRRRGLALFDEVGAGRKPFEIDEIGRISERCRLAREDRQCADEVLRAFEAGRQLDDPLSQAVAQKHPASRPVAYGRVGSMWRIASRSRPR